MFRNKHVLAALIIAPILSILAYFAVDSMVSEKPHQAVAGGSYELVPKSNCRYTSGRCDLSNGNFKVSLQATYLVGGELLLSLESAFPLQGGRIALVDKAGASADPLELQSVSSDALSWTVTLPRPASQDSQIQLALSAKDTLYYAQTGLVFTHYETNFARDFRSE